MSDYRHSTNSLILWVQLCHKLGVTQASRSAARSSSATSTASSACRPRRRTSGGVSSPLWRRRQKREL
eukprot:3242065-Heterocapsa_arctica.AAC.1